MDVVKASALALEIEKKINEGLADKKKPWIFYQAQLELDDLLAMISAASASATISKTSAPPGRGGATPPGRGGPPPPSGPGPKVMSSGGLGAASGKSPAVTKGTTSAPPGRGGPPPPPSGPGPKVMSSGGLGAASVKGPVVPTGTASVAIKIDTIIIKSMLGDVAKLKTLLVDTSKISESKNLAEKLKNDFAKALEEPNQNTIVPPEFHGEMAAFKAKHTRTKVSENILSIETELRSNVELNAKELLLTNSCDLCLMSDLKDGDPANAEPGKLYLSHDGKYVACDPKGIVQQDTLPKIDMNDLEKKLSDPVFKKSVLEVTSTRGHTKTHALTVFSTITNIFTDKALAPTKKLPPAKAKQNLSAQLQQLTENLTQTKTPDSFLNNYIYNTDFRKKIDAENGGKPIFNDKKIKDTVEKLGKYKEELDKLVIAKDAAGKIPNLIAVKKAEDEIEKLVENIEKFRTSHPQTIKEPAPLVSTDDFADKGVFNFDSLQKEFLALQQNEQEILGYLFIVETELPGGSSHKDHALIQKIFSDQKIRLIAKTEIADIKKSSVLTPAEKSAKINAIKKDLLSKGVINLGNDIATTLTKTLSPDSASLIPDLADVLTNRADVFKEQMNIAHKLENKVQLYSNKTQKIFDGSKTPPEVSLTELFKTKEGAAAIKKSLLEQTDALIAPHKKVKKATATATAAATSNPLDTLNIVQALQKAQFNFKPDKGKAENAPFDDFFDIRGSASARNAPIKLAFAKFLTDKSAAKTRILFDADGDPSKLSSLLKADDPLSPPVPNIVLLAIASGYLMPKPGIRLDMLKRQIDFTTFDKNINKEKVFQTMLSDVYEQLKTPVTPSVLTNAVAELDALLKTPNYSVELKKLDIKTTESIKSPAAFLAAKAGGAPLTKAVKATTPSGLSKPPASSISSAGGAPISGVPSSPPVVPPVAAVTFSAGASSKSLSGGGSLGASVPMDEVKARELRKKIKKEGRDLEVLKLEIKVLNGLKTSDISKFNLLGGDGALNAKIKQQTILEASISTARIELNSMGTSDPANTSRNISEVIKKLEGGVSVDAPTQIAVLKSAVASIDTLTLENDRNELLKDLPEYMIKEFNSGKPTNELFKYAASVCLDKSEFSKGLDDTLGKISGNRDLLKLCQALYKALMTMKQKGGFEAQYDTYKPASSPGVKIK